MCSCQLGGGVGASLDANNVFTGTNTFNNGISINNQLTLPTTYSAPPTSFQLGGVSDSGTFAGVSLVSTNTHTTCSVNIGPGTYILMLNVVFSVANSGSTLTLTRSALEISPTSGFASNISFVALRTSTALAISQSHVYTTSYIHSSADTSTTLYGLVSFNFSGNTATATGKMRYVRIA